MSDTETRFIHRSSRGDVARPRTPAVAAFPAPRQRRPTPFDGPSADPAHLVPWPIGLIIVFLGLSGFKALFAVSRDHRGRSLPTGVAPRRSRPHAAPGLVLRRSPTCFLRSHQLQEVVLHPLAPAEICGASYPGECPAARDAVHPAGHSVRTDVRHYGSSPVNTAWKCAWSRRSTSPSSSKSNTSTHWTYGVGA